MGCNASTAAGNQPDAAPEEGPTRKGASHLSVPKGSASRAGAGDVSRGRARAISDGVSSASITAAGSGDSRAFAAWGSGEVADGGAGLRMQISVDMEPDSPAVRPAAPVHEPDSFDVIAAPPRGKQRPASFKWISDTMWEAGTVCAACGGADPTLCAPACRAAGQRAARYAQHGGSKHPSFRWLRQASPLSLASERLHGGSPCSRLAVHASPRVAHLSGHGGGGSIAQYRLGQAMAAMRLRRGSPSQLSIRHGPTPRSVSSLKFSLVGSANRSMSPMAQASTLRPATAETTGSGHTSMCTPMSGAGDNESVGSGMSFFTFNTLLGYSHRDVLSPERSLRGWSPRSTVAAAPARRRAAVF